jgi:transcription elongation factor Elf1
LDDEDSILWQDVLDEVAAGRTQNLVCPFCQKGALVVTVEQTDQRTRLECRSCRRFIEGRMANQ